MTESQAKDKYPKRLWLAGPAPYVAQETILMRDGITRLAFHDGSLVVHTAEQEATVRRAMGDRVFDEDSKKPITFRRTGWSTLSRDAYEAHTNLVEG